MCPTPTDAAVFPLVMFTVTEASRARSHATSPSRAAAPIDASHSVRQGRRGAAALRAVLLPREPAGVHAGRPERDHAGLAGEARRVARLRVRIVGRSPSAFA
eukprot:4586807-Prymnesium_polylepis.1